MTDTYVIFIYKLLKINKCHLNKKQKNNGLEETQ